MGFLSWTLWTDPWGSTRYSRIGRYLRIGGNSKIDQLMLMKREVKPYWNERLPLLSRILQSICSVSVYLLNKKCNENHFSELNYFSIWLYRLQPMRKIKKIIKSKENCFKIKSLEPVHLSFTSLSVYLQRMIFKISWIVIFETSFIFNSQNWIFSCHKQYKIHGRKL